MCSQRVPGPPPRRLRYGPVEAKQDCRPTGLALVQVGLAVVSAVARRAGAAVGPAAVEAGGAVPTGALHTLVDVHLTRLA